MKTNRFIIFCLSVILALSFSNCSKSYEEPPSVPGENTLTMDLSLMDMQKSVTGTDTSNYNLARKILMFWDSTAALHNSVPKNALKAALSVSPTITNPKMWSWTFSFKIGDSDYLGELNSITTVLVDSLKKDGTKKDSVEWTLYTAEIGGNEAYINLTGKSATDNSGGWWLISFDKSENTHPYLMINWAKENDILTKIQYTNVYSSDTNFGSKILYGRILSTNYDRAYNTIIKNYPLNPALINNKNVAIGWQYAGKNGTLVIDGSIWGCWDTNFKNLSTCSE